MIEVGADALSVEEVCLSQGQIVTFSVDKQPHEDQLYEVSEPATVLDSQGHVLLLFHLPINPLGRSFNDSLVLALFLPL